jgi:hypothetical protein
MLTKSQKINYIQALNTTVTEQITYYANDVKGQEMEFNKTQNKNKHGKMYNMKATKYGQ